MSEFTEFDDYVQAGGYKYRLLNPLKWEVGRKGSGLIVEVPAGFEFDVTVPWGLRWLIKRRDRKLLLAAAVHDWLMLDGWSRNRAAIELYHGLRAMNVNRFWAVAIGAVVFLWTTR